MFWSFSNVNVDGDVWAGALRVQDLSLSKFNTKFSTSYKNSYQIEQRSTTIQITILPKSYLIENQVCTKPNYLF